MNIIQHTEEWVKGEVFQGKIMLAIGILLSIAFFTIIKGQNDLLKGTLIPLGFMLVILFGYGGFQTYKRPAHLQKVKEVYQQNPQKAINAEYEKAIKDHNNYSMLKRVWTVLIVLSAIGFFLFSKEYFKGLSIGLIALFLTTLIVDSILHQHLLVYLEYLKKSLELL